MEKKYLVKSVIVNTYSDGSKEEVPLVLPTITKKLPQALTISCTFLTSLAEICRKEEVPSSTEVRVVLESLAALFGKDRAIIRSHIWSFLGMNPEQAAKHLYMFMIKGFEERALYISSGLQHQVGQTIKDTPAAREYMNETIEALMRIREEKHLYG